MNDHPRDKATYDISVAAPDGREVMSAGRLAWHQPAGPVPDLAPDR
ncbi:MAG TPA: hypothetical protein VGP26_08590 [Actinophytocola sp.]|nr:hypothetical protein [Actinophytocola sp.]